MTETTTIFTMAQFAMIGLFAILVIVGILFGMRMKRRRIRAEKEVDANREAALESDDGQSTPFAEPAPPAPKVVEPEAPVAAPTPAAPIDQVAAPEPVPPAAPVTAPKPAAPQPVDDPVAPTPPAPAPTALAGDITQLKGLGPKLAATLADLGITRVDQIAAMTPADLADLDARLGAFKGRPTRDRWAEQAALLVAGDRAAYEAEFGKLG